MESLTPSRKVRRSLWVEESLWDTLKQRSRREHRSITSLILHAVALYLEREAIPVRVPGEWDTGDEGDR